MPRRKLDYSFITTLENFVPELTDWAYNYVNTMTKALMPDGRPFGKVKRSEAEEVQEYMKLKGNPMAWSAWMQEQVDWVIEQLKDVPPEQVAGIHPYTVVANYAIMWSADMERIASRHARKHEEAHPPPSFMGEDDGSG